MARVFHLLNLGPVIAMCGVVGIFHLLQNKSVSGELLHRMNQMQFHRGPDEGDVYINNRVGLGHRRLSIIDLSTGKQPMTNEDGSVHLVYNGELYNFLELRAELIDAGHIFTTHSDTEVIVHGWEEWGEDCVSRFRGMFAFALWDGNRKKLFIARDRLGIKPMHYAILGDGTFLFSSEIKAILSYPGVSRELNPCSVEEYFALGYIPDPKTIFKHINKLSPGHTLTLSQDSERVAPQQYWDINFDNDHHYDSLSTDDIAAELIDRLEEAVRIRMIADVPLGAFLSGGVDSSSVVAMMAKSSSEPVNTCSISFSEQEFDESHYASKVASLYGTNHVTGHVNPDDYSLIERLASIYDEPFADSSSMPTFRVCELARKKVTVALSGDGGDENFAGYSRYRWHMNEERIRSFLPFAFRHSIFGIAGRFYPKMDWAPRILRAKSTLMACSRDSVDGYFQNISVIPQALRTKLYSNKLNADLAGYSALEVFRKHAANAPDDTLSKVQYIDFKTYLPEDILTKVDRASMANSLEVRVPILDHEFVGWIARLGPSIKLRDNEGKWIFKKSMEPYLPDDVLYRKKMGFAVPISKWFRNELSAYISESLMGEHMRDSGLFDMARIESMLNNHRQGKSEYGSALWSLLMFESFLKNTAGSV